MAQDVKGAFRLSEMAGQTGQFAEAMRTFKDLVMR